MLSRASSRALVGEMVTWDPAESSAALQQQHDKRAAGRSKTPKSLLGNVTSTAPVQAPLAAPAKAAEVPLTLINVLTEPAPQAEEDGRETSAAQNSRC